MKVIMSEIEEIDFSIWRVPVANELELTLLEDDSTNEVLIDHLMKSNKAYGNEFNVLVEKEGVEHKENVVNKGSHENVHIKGVTKDGILHYDYETNKNRMLEDIVYPTSTEIIDNKPECPNYDLIAYIMFMFMVVKMK